MIRSGENLIWYMNGATFAGEAALIPVPDPNWIIVGTGDFNGDAKPDHSLAENDYR